MIKLTGTYPEYSHACDCDRDTGFGIHVYFLKDNSVSIINNDKMQGIALSSENFENLIEIYQQVKRTLINPEFPSTNQFYVISERKTLSQILMFEQGWLRVEDRSDVLAYNQEYGTSFHAFICKLAEQPSKAYKEVWGVDLNTENPEFSNCYKIELIDKNHPRRFK